MNRAAKTLRVVSLGSLACACYAMPGWSQLDEVSVPEPSQLHAVASADGSKVIWSEVVGTISSPDANAEVSAIAVETADGVQVRGVKVMLKTSTSSDQIYVTDTMLSDLRGELQELEYTRQFDSACQARYRCVHGVARCRPSQTERQAYCPGRYSTPNSEVGLILYTARSSFSFPSVDPGQLDTLIGKAVQVLEQKR